MIGIREPRPKAGGRAPAARTYAWIFGARADLTIALCWVPIFLVAHRLSAGNSPGNDDLLNTLFRSAFVLSLLHQPLTLALVYGDREQFDLRRRLFTWSPPIAVALIAVAVLLNLWIIVPVAAIWNTVHTLQQRYGLSRIYSRKAGYGSARLDRLTLYAWMAAAVVIVGSAPTTLDQLARVMLDRRNSAAIVSLTGVRPYALSLLVPALVASAVLAGLLVRQEVRHRDRANRAKWIYQISSLALIAAIALDPLAGFIAYVAAHAIEYFVVVYKTMQSRYGRPRERRPLLGRAAGSPVGRVAFFAAFLGLFLVFDSKADRALPANAYDIALYSIGILHFWYDSFIWKLRKPAVAANFGIPAPA